MAVNHLLVTNDFPPKIGGIQSYLFELWSRLPVERFAVITTDHEGAAIFDASQSMHVERVDARMLVPGAKLRDRINAVAREIDAGIVLIDPAFPLGAIGRSLERPYGLVLHGAEVTVPARLPGSRALLRRVIEGATIVIAAGGYPAREARYLAGASMPRTVVVPPGVDASRFVPLSAEERTKVRDRMHIETDALMITSISRLVPRKGMDVLIEASASLREDHPDLIVLIGGAGRDGARLGALAQRLSAPVRFLGRVDDRDLPGIYGASDLAVMLCRNRWMGLEQEGFGIVFLEAAAAGIAQVAGRSGGAGEAVIDGETGLVVDRPADVVVARKAIRSLLEDRTRREQMGRGARTRVEREFDYVHLAHKLGTELGSIDG